MQRAALMRPCALRTDDRVESFAGLVETATRERIACRILLGGVSHKALPLPGASTVFLSKPVPLCAVQQQQARAKVKHTVALVRGRSAAGDRTPAHLLRSRCLLSHALRRCLVSRAAVLCGPTHTASDLCGVAVVACCCLSVEQRAAGEQRGAVG
eukprot:SAG22_NODE_188_length_15821_cov_38.313319_19_plen_155_part_00